MKAQSLPIPETNVLFLQDYTSGPIHLNHLLETLPTNLENCEPKGSFVTIKKEKKKVKKRGLSDPNVIFSNDQCLEMKENSTFLLMKMVHIGYVFD